MPATSTNRRNIVPWWPGRLFFCAFILAGTLLTGQYVPTHISNTPVYDFLEELATQGIIDISTLKKPYSRILIAEKLVDAEAKRAQLSVRQQSELDFYMKDYMKELPSPTGRSSGPAAQATSWMWQKNHPGKRFDVFYFSDSLFRITANPIVGTDFYGNSNGTFYHWWNGVEAWSTVGRFGFWASLRDNHESTELTARDFMNQRIGAANIKITDNGNRDYEEFRGGVSYAWRWGHVGLIMDQFSWGESNAGSNILSGRTPSFPRLELSLDPAGWFSFRYFHGVLVSEVVDSSLSYYIPNTQGTDYREVYHSKFMAANLFTFIPIQGLELSVGNSVVYDNRFPNAGFLIPIAFYKAIDHTLNAGTDNMNSQLFLSASSRNIQRVHLYSSLFIDEFAIGRIFNKDEFNFLSWKAGVSAYPLQDARIVAEYTWTNALTFQHYIATTTFESNQYNLGHYLEDNARDLYLALQYRPYRALDIRAYYNHSVKGPDHNTLGTPRISIVPFDPIVWESTKLGILATFQVINDLYIRTGIEQRNVTGDQAYLDLWTPEVYHGRTTTWRLGVNYGF